MRIPRHFGASGSKFPPLEFKTALAIRELEMHLRLREFREFPGPIQMGSMLLTSDIFCTGGHLSPGRVGKLAQAPRLTPHIVPKSTLQFSKKIDIQSRARSRRRPILPTYR